MLIKRPVGRPLGEYSVALLKAAEQGPATMRELAHLSLVSVHVARHKVKALARAGSLVALTPNRPRVYALPEHTRQPAVPIVDLAAAWWTAGRANDLQATHVSTEV